MCFNKTITCDERGTRKGSSLPSFLLFGGQFQIRFLKSISFHCACENSQLLVAVSIPNSTACPAALSKDISTIRFCSSEY